MNEKPKTEQNQVVPPVGDHDLTITGMLVATQSDNIQYISKKTNLQTEAKRDVLVVKCSFGVVLCRAFNPETDTSKLVEGNTYTFAVNEYRIDNGVKMAQVRI